MSELGERDLRAMLAFLAEASAVDVEDVFPERVAERLHGLIGGEAGAFCRLNRIGLDVHEQISSPADDPDRAFVLLDRSEHVDAATPRAHELLQAWFGSSCNGRLPEDVARWLRGRRGDVGLSRSRDPLRLVRGGRSLTVDLAAADVLVLQQRNEAPESASLTLREREVLECVAAGMSNKEIAVFFSIAPGTVRKHLEHVYAKLGVTSRTAALARIDGRVAAAH